MFKKAFFSVGLLLSVLLLTACSTIKPVLNLTNQPVPANMTSSQVATHIMAGGKERGWYMTRVKPGLIRGSIEVRQHYASVDINYSSKGYSISYRSSRNLEYENGQIHRNYNRWVMNLSESIQASLKGVQTTTAHKKREVGVKVDY